MLGAAALGPIGAVVAPAASSSGGASAPSTATASSAVGVSPVSSAVQTISISGSSVAIGPSSSLASSSAAVSTSLSPRQSAAAPTTSSAPISAGTHKQVTGAGAPTPASPVLDVGQTIVLSSSPTGVTGTLSYQWWFSPTGAGTCGPGSPNIGLGTGAQQAVGQILSEGVGIYYFCYVVNDTGPFSTAASPWDALTVDSDPTVAIAPPHANHVDIGQTIVFTATPSGGSGSFSYAWTFTGTCPNFVSPGNSPTLSYGPATITTSTCSLQVTITDTGLTAGATPTPITASNTASLMVLADPTVSLSPTSVAMDEFQAITITATASLGSGSYSYAWTIFSGACPGFVAGGGNPFTYTSSGTTINCVITVTVTDTGTTAGATPTITATPVTNTAVTVNTPLTNPTISVPAAPVALDQGQSVGVTGNIPATGTPNYGYLWLVQTNGAGGYVSAVSFCSPNSAGLGSTPAGPVSTTCSGLTSPNFYNFKLQITDNSGGDSGTETTTSAASPTVTVSPALGTPALSPASATIDAGQTVTYTATWSGGTSTYTVSLYTSGTSSTCNSGSTLVQSAPGVVGSPYVFTATGGALAAGFTYHYCVVVTDSATTPETTTSSPSTSLVVNTGLTTGSPTPTSPTLDVNQSTLLSATGTSGGTAPYINYQWYSWPGAVILPGSCAGATSIPGATSSTYLAAPTSTTYYCYTVQDSSLNPPTADSGFDLISVNPALQPGYVYPHLPVLLNGGSITLYSSRVMAGTPSITIQWYYSSSLAGACSAGFLIPGASGVDPPGLNLSYSTGALPTGVYYYCYTVHDSATSPQTVSSAKDKVTVLAVITFIEGGVPVGVLPTIAIPSATPAIPATPFNPGGTLSEDLANGTYPLVVVTPAGYVLSSISVNPVIVAGLNYNVILSFNAVTSVSFVENHLHSGGIWNVTVNSIVYTSGTIGPGTNTIVVPNLVNGSYTYSIGNYRGWHITVGSYTGGFTVSGFPPVPSTATFTVTFSQVVYAVTFSESGLTGEHWAVSINGTLYFATAPASISTTLPNGTLYAYVIEDVAGWHQVTLPYTGGTFNVVGAPVNQAIVFTQVLYAVTFSETGLVAPTWGVTINGTLYLQPTPTSVVANLPNGTFTYAIRNAPGWHQLTLPYSGTVTPGVAGAPFTEPTLLFTQVTYTMTFTESGLTGELWGVTLNGTLYTSVSTTVSTTTGTPTGFPNGTVTYVIGGVAGWHESTLAYSGSVHVAGGTGTISGSGAGYSSVTIIFTQVVYTVTFTESGLTAGVHYTVTINGTGYTGIAGTSSATTTLPNGTVLWHLQNVPGWRVTTVAFYSAQSGTVAGGTGAIGGSGAGFVQALAFTQVLYTVTFTESGLTAGVHYTVTINGTGYTGVAGTSSATTNLPNGTVTWQVQNVPGWRLTTPAFYSLQSGTVAGGNGAIGGTGVGFTQALAFTQVMYTVTFSESGLTGEHWAVTINNTLYFATAPASISATSPNGTYPYVIQDVPGWHQVTLPYSGGTFTVVGGAGTISGSYVAVNLAIVFTQVVYAVTFSETGLVGPTWSVTINGTLHIQSTPAAIAVNLPNGTWTYAISNVPGWHQVTLAYSGGSSNLGSVNGAPLTPPTLVFTQVKYTVRFTETGLTGENWGVTINGTLYTSATGTVTTVGFVPAGYPNGTITYVIGDVPGWHQFSLLYSGTQTVSGGVTNIGPSGTIGVGFTTAMVFSQVRYTVSFSETGLCTAVGVPLATCAGHAEWAVSINGTLLFASAGTAITASSPNGTYPYVIEDVAGWHQTTIPYSGTFTVAAGTNAISGSYVAVNEAIVFTQVTYAVTFTETGLTGEVWAVTINGTLYFATAPASISTNLPNGTWTYGIQDVPGWHQLTFAYGTHTSSTPVNGGPLNKGPVVFTQVTYAITFSESGLATGVTWSITFNVSNSQSASAPASITFQSPNGTYPYLIGGVAGWHTSGGYTGSFSVTGAPANKLIVFTQFTYAVTFTVSGLTGETWSITVNQSFPNQQVLTLAGNGARSAQLPNGTFTYLLGDISGWHETNFPYSGSGSVHGAAVSEPATGSIVFTQVTYAVLFTESGLTTQVWGVTFNGTTLTTAAPSSITFQSPNGTYPWTISDVPGWHISVGHYSGSSSVAGARNAIGGSYTAVTVATTFVKVLYTVTISESTLPSGVTWSITINGVPQSLTTNGGLDTLTWTGVANGTYSYSIADISGWHQLTLPYSGTLNVAGGTNSISGSGIGYANTLVYYQVFYTVTFTESGLPSETTWSVTFNSATQMSAGTSITFSEPNGTYPFTTESAGYSATPASGSITVSTTLSQAISFAPIAEQIYAETTAYYPNIQTYALPQIQEFTVGSGRGTVLVNFVELYLTGSGTVVFSLGSMKFGSDQLLNTSVVVEGAGWYTTTFPAINMALGTDFYLNVYETSGSVQWGYTTSPAVELNTLTEYYYVLKTLTSSTVTPDLYVVGQGAGVLLEYPVTFTETGMPSAAGGGVAFNGGETTPFGLGGTLTFMVEPGTYSYVVTAGSGYQLVSALPGSPLEVSSPGANVNVVFEKLYTVTFTESGVTSGNQWTVQLNRVTENANAPTSIVFTETNGTYAFSASSAGYTATPSSGNVNVPEGPLTLNIAFSGVGPPPSAVSVYAETNSSLIYLYSLTQIQEFTVGSGRGTVPVNFVTLYLTGSGTVWFSIGSEKFGSDALGNTSVVVNGAGWYNVSFATINLALGTDYFLNVYETSGIVQWGYTTVPAATVFLNTIEEYYYVGHALTTSIATPDLYIVGYADPPVATHATTPPALGPSTALTHSAVAVKIPELWMLERSGMLVKPAPSA